MGPASLLVECQGTEEPFKVYSAVQCTQNPVSIFLCFVKFSLETCWDDLPSIPVYYVAYISQQKGNDMIRQGFAKCSKQTAQKMLIRIDLLQLLMPQRKQVTLPPARFTQLHPSYVNS